MSFFHAMLTIKRNQYYQDYIDYITSIGEPLPTQSAQIAGNVLFTQLDDAGFMARIKAGYIFHSGSLNGACIVNFKAPGTFTLLTPNDPFFFEEMGCRSTSLDGYFSCPYKSDQYAGIESDLTTVTYIPYYHDYSNRGLARLAWGQNTRADGANGNYVYPFYTDNKLYGRHYAPENNFANTDHRGLYIETYDGTNHVVYKDGTKNSFAETTVAPNISTNRLILTTNLATTTGATTVPADMYTNFISFQFFMDRINDADEATLRGILNTYIAATQIGYGLTLESASNCWFSNPPTAYNASANKSWFGQVHQSATVTTYTQYIFERNHTTGLLNYGFRLGTVVEQDDHNEPAILVRASDSKLIVVYAEHVGAVIRWRISTNATDASAFGSENTIDPSAGVRGYTYPSVFQVTNGDIYIFYRGSDLSASKWYYIISTDNGVSFGSETLFWERTYTNIYQDPSDLDIIHFIGSPHANEHATVNPIVSHFYFDAGANTWHKSDGTSAGSLPLDQGDVTSIFTKTTPESVWFEDLVLDGNGYPRVSMIYYPNFTADPKIKHRYYTEWNGSSWSTPFDMGEVMDISISGGTSLGVDSYTGGAHFDPANPDILFASIQVGTKLEMFKLSRISASSFGYTQLTFNSAYHQWRPIVSDSPDHNVFWLASVLYTDYLVYYQVLINKTLLS